MPSITPDLFKKWQGLTGTSVRVAADQVGISKSALARWSNGVGKLSKAQLSALQALCRGAPVPMPMETAEPALVASQSDMQTLARATTASCVALWKAIVDDPTAALPARLRASEALMSYAWGNPPKLQSERKVEAPAKDNELIEKFGRLAGGKPT